MVGLSPFSYLIIISLITVLLLGILEGASKSFIHGYGVYRFIVYRNIVIVLGVISIIFFQLPTFNFDPIYWVYTLLIATVASFPLALLFKAFEKGEVGLISSVMSSKLIVSVLFGIVFMNQSVSRIGWGLLLIVLVGLFVLLVDFKKLSIANIKPWIGYLIPVLIMWGILGPLYGMVSKVIGILVFTLILESGVLIYALINLKKEKKKLHINRLFSKRGINLIIYSIFAMLGSFLLSYSFSLNNIAVTSAILSIAPLIVVIYGMIVYKERLTMQQHIAILMIITGLVLFSLNS